MSWKALFLLLAFGGAAILAPPAPARAERDIQAEQTDETINNTVKSLNRTERSEEKARSRQKVLEQQHDALEFQRRTGAPFRSAVVSCWRSRATTVASHRQSGSRRPSARCSMP